MTGLMRSRVSGCLCQDCSGGWHKDRAQEKREWEKHVRDEDYDVPYNVGEIVPGWCGGTFSLDSMDDDLRVEAAGFDWLVLRGARNGEVYFYQGRTLISGITRTGR